VNFATEPVHENLYFPEIDGASGRLLFSTEPEAITGMRLGDHGRVSLQLRPRHGQIFAVEAPTATVRPARSDVSAEDPQHQ
jgi:hypothetical protein